MNTIYAVVSGEYGEGYDVTSVHKTLTGAIARVQDQIGTKFTKDEDDYTWWSSSGIDYWRIVFLQLED